MKKISGLKNSIAVIMISLFVCILFSLRVSAADIQILADGYCGDVKWELDDTGILNLTAENGTMDDFTGTDDETAWHQYKEQIVEVKINDGVKNISKSAFEGCVNLAAVTIPESVESVHATAFLETAYLNNLIAEKDGEIVDNKILLYYDAVQPLQGTLYLSYFSDARIVADDVLVNCDVSNVNRLWIGKEVETIGYLGIVPEEIYYEGSRTEWDQVKKSDKDDFSMAKLEVSEIAKPVLKLTNSEEGVLVEWTSVYGAEEYRIYRRKNNNASVLVKTIKDMNVTSYLDTKPQTGVFTYEVWAWGSGTKSYSATKKVVKMAAATTLSVSNGHNGIVLSWKNVSPYTSYRVERKVDGGKWAKVTLQKNGYKTSMIDKNVKAGKKYSYRICMTYDDVKGPYSAVVTIKRLLCPKGENGVNVTNGIKVSWKKSVGAEGYYIYRKVSGGSAKLIATIKKGTTLSYVDKNVTFGKNYVYRVIAYAGKKTCHKEDHEWTVGVRRVAKPKSLTLKNTKNGVSLKWSKVKYAEGYRVYRKLSGGTWKLLKVITKENTVTYLDKSAKNGKKYSYKVETLHDTLSPVKTITCKK